MIMVTAGDSGASLTARSERGAAGAALGGRGERAEKADSGASQPHIEGTLIYVIARCGPGTAVSGDVARRAARGRGHAVAVQGRAGGIRALGRDPGHNTEFPGCAVVRDRETGSTPRACWDRKRLEMDGRPEARVAARVWPGDDSTRLPPSAPLQFPPLSRKESVSRIGRLLSGAQLSLRGLHYGMGPGRCPGSPTSGPRLLTDFTRFT